MKQWQVRDGAGSDVVSQPLCVRHEGVPASSNGRRFRRGKEIALLRNVLRELPGPRLRTLPETGQRSKFMHVSRTPSSGKNHN